MIAVSIVSCIIAGLPPKTTIIASIASSIVESSTKKSNNDEPAIPASTIYVINRLPI